MSKEKIFTRTILMLSFVSLFNDVGSEMLIPVMPIYLKSIGFTALWIGILEGSAEVVAGVSKGYFGKLSDEKGKRLPFVQFGYLLSNISKPLIATFVNPIWVLFVRSGDKLGKGIRTGARDAMLSDECSKENKGKVFGFHRAMDTVGAAIGPALALAFLYYNPANYKSLFLIAFIPGSIAVLFTFLIKEKQKSVISKSSKRGFFSYFLYWKAASAEYKKLVTGLLLFALFNSSDVFLLLMAKNIGFDDLHIIGVYIFYNLVYALFSFPLGSLADKIGMKTIFILGMFLYAVMYFGMTSVKEEWMLYLLFFIYGIYAAATDGVSKAWISKIVPSSETATAIGFHASCNSLLMMVASSLAGLLWVLFNPATMFIVSAVGVLVVIIYFLIQSTKEEVLK
jgi:MFS family permease